MTRSRRRDDADEPARQTVGWLRLLTILAVALPLSWFAGTQAVGMTMSRFNPAVAVEAAPHNGEALARLAELKLVSGVQAAGGEFPAPLSEPLWRDSKESFLKAPLAVRAIRIAALSREAAGEHELARRLMRSAVKLTKRDLATHLWLLTDYGRAGDLDGLLHHYDLALRTSSQAPRILLPRLALALNAPGAVEAIAPVLAQQPPWAAQFWRTTYVTPEALPKATELRLALFEQDVPVPEDVDRRLILSLARDREWDIATALYRRVAGENAPALERVDQTDLSRVPKLPPIEWSFPSSGLQSGEIVPETGRMILSGGASSSGVAASRVVALEPGRYEVRLERAEPEEGNKADVAVEVVCVDTVPQSRIARFRGEGSGVQGSFETGASCRYYALQIHLQVPRDSISGQVIVEDLALLRV